MIFDCDGVLVDSERLMIHYESIGLRKAGFDISADEIAQRYVGLSYADMKAGLETQFASKIPDGLLEAIEADVLSRFAAELEPIDGMAELLASLSLPTCVGSSSDPERIELSLDVTGLSTFFDRERIFSATMVERGKPAPDLFEHAAARCGVGPVHCIVVEDSPHGVSAAVAANMAVVGFAGGGHASAALTQRLHDAGAVTVARHADELAAHLTALSP
ncbi:MAG: HAD-IA family hydrolase [Acidobacteria bacterium]|nr:HAD-IA family hydrolase [Acidobacteriota bacterium]